MNRRIIHNDNGTLRDYTHDLNNYYSGVKQIDFISSQDTLFIGSVLPFNHIFIRTGDTKNSIASSARVHLWSSSTWNIVAETFDTTSNGTATLSRNGYLSWVPDKQKSWQWEDTVDSNGNELVTSLGSVTIYDKYWAAINFSESLTSNLQIEWIGNIFSDDTALYTEYPEFKQQSIKDTFVSNKTSWEEQTVRAGEIIEQDLISRKRVTTPDEILDHNDLKLASIHKTAEIIYGALGEDYNDDREKAQKAYNARIDRTPLKVDSNNDGRVNRHEERIRTGVLFR